MLEKFQKQNLRCRCQSGASGISLLCNQSFLFDISPILVLWTEKVISIEDVQPESLRFCDRISFKSRATYDLTRSPWTRKSVFGGSLVPQGNHFRGTDKQIAPALEPLSLTEMSVQQKTPKASDLLFVVWKYRVRLILLSKQIFLATGHWMTFSRPRLYMCWLKPV